MKNRLFLTLLTFAIVLGLLGQRTQDVSAISLSAPAAIASPLKLILPIPPTATYASYSQGPHLSGLRFGYITNRGVQSNSIDIGYSGPVVAPITGNIGIAKDCGSEQIIFVSAPTGSDGYGWSIALVHIKKAAGIYEGLKVVQGQTIGFTVPPLPYPGNGCGYGYGEHIHMGIMTYTFVSNGPIFTEQPFSNINFGQWAISSGMFKSSVTGASVSVGGQLIDYAKFISARSGKSIDGWYLASNNNGAQIWDFSSGNFRQQWKVVPVPGETGYYFLVNRQHNKCLEIPWGSKDNGVRLRLWDCGNGDSQKFSFIPLSNAPGKFALKLKHSGKVVDVPTNWSDLNSGKANGTPIQQWDGFFGNNQQWSISKP